jgi:hypothetical protein
MGMVRAAQRLKEFGDAVKFEVLQNRRYHRETYTPSLNKQCDASDCVDVSKLAIFLTFSVQMPYSRITM